MLAVGDGDIDHLYWADAATQTDVLTRASRTATTVRNTNQMENNTSLYNLHGVQDAISDNFTYVKQKEIAVNHCFYIDCLFRC